MQLVVVNGTGYRFIAGDYNHDSLPETLIWEAAGWIEIQQLQQYVTGQPPYLTYRGKSRPDRIYISPELAAVFVTTSFQQQFADHGALWATFQLPDSPATKWVWPMPSLIPWDEVDRSTYLNADHHTPSFDPQNTTNSYVMVCPQPVPDGDSTYIANNKHYMPLGQNLAEKARYSLHPACFAEQSSSRNGNALEPKSKSIKPTAKPAMDWLTSTTSANIIAVSDDGTQILTDQDISLGHLNTCHINDTPALLHQLDTCTYQVDDTDLLIFPGQSVHCEQHLTLDDEIHQELPPGGWARITAFIQAYVLAGSLTLPELQPQTWETALNRFGDEGQMDSTPRTSRLCLTPSRTRSSITSRALKQVLHGQNNSFKVSLALEVLEPLLDFPSFGFLPTRKTRQLWLPLQGLIELSAQRNQPLLGCGMSCLAMVLTSWCYHTYQSVYAPNSIALSYIDNLEQLWTILQDFKRVLSKTASMLTHWQQYMAAYDGTLGAGVNGGLCQTSIKGLNAQNVPADTVEPKTQSITDASAAPHWKHYDTNIRLPSNSGTIPQYVYVNGFYHLGHVWSDSSYVVRGTWRLLDDPSDHPRTNHDLWQCLRDACDLLQPGQLRIHHVASHREPEDCDDPVDAWSAYWNGQADELAKFTNQNRDFAFAGFWNQYQAAENDMATRLRLLTFE
ncbi:unnamed protein product [Effrenium voratum]|nr:unnamed protein product [Effrenium voratum]